VGSSLDRSRVEFGSERDAQNALPAGCSKAIRYKARISVTSNE
jgi:hypothetical protein